MDTSPLFSILIAQYNNAQYLQEAIDSAFIQSYKNWEIIIVDDASTDFSKEVYKNIEHHKNIKIYYNDSNKGVAFTKKRCIELANGEICGFLDPDDILLPNALQISVEVHQKNPDTALTFSRFYFYNEKKRETLESRLLTIPKNKTYFTNLDYCPEHFATFKKYFYKKTEGISTKYKLGIDQDLYFKLEEVGDISIINDFTYKYRFHTNSISYNADKAFFWNLIIRYDTCLRRNLNSNEYPLINFTEYVNHKINIEKEKIHLEELKNVQLKRSLEYRIGRTLLKPFKLLQKIFP